MKFNSKNSFKSLDNISSLGKDYKIFNLKKAEKNGLDGISKLPKSLKVLLENLLRYEDDLTVDKKQIVAIKEWLKNKKSNTEIAYRPARTLLQKNLLLFTTNQNDQQEINVQTKALRRTINYFKLY